MSIRGIIGALAVVLLAAGCSDAKDDANKTDANQHAMGAAAYKQAVKAMRDVARQTTTSPGDGRLVGAVKPSGKVLLITSAGQGDDLCLQARVYGTQQRAFLDTPRTKLPTAKACAWFLENPKAVPSNTEIADFGASDLVFGPGD